MVPVKKPGRPLSACPHLHNQLCGCSSVTAAIPRKQKCHCGSQPTAQPRPVLSATPDIPSPTKSAFRVQKPPLASRPGSRKQSYDLSNLERMDASNINITLYQASATQPALSQALGNGHSTASTHGSYTNGSQRPQSSAGAQDPLLQSQYPNLSFLANLTNEVYSTGYPVAGSPIVTSNGSYLGHETNGESSMVHIKASGSGSCCSAKPDIRNESLTFEPQSHETKDSISGPVLSGVSSISARITPETPIANGHSKTQRYPFTDNFPTSQDLYSSFVPETTVYAYPPSYGSYQQPIQPSQWRRDAMFNTYTQPTPQPGMTDKLNTIVSDIFPNLDTLHTCSCGDVCQCIGCPAHPYNDATRNLVRSAYIHSHKPSTFATSEFSNGQTNGARLPSSTDPHANGNSRMPNSGEETSPPHTDTPSDSSTVDEQILPASDYFFVNYPFSSDGCGGDIKSCPCGDDCECVGCTIHRFDESSMALPSESGVNEHSFTNEDGAELLNGISVKDEHLIDEFTDEPKKSCCG
jgi:hypothetical protein